MKPVAFSRDSGAGHPTVLNTTSAGLRIGVTQICDPPQYIRCSPFGLPGESGFLFPDYHPDRYARSGTDHRCRTLCVIDRTSFPIYLLSIVRPRGIGTGRFFDEVVGHPRAGLGGDGLGYNCSLSLSLGSNANPLPLAAQLAEFTM